MTASRSIELTSVGRSTESKWETQLQTLIDTCTESREQTEQVLRRERRHRLCLMADYVFGTLMLLTWVTLDVVFFVFYI